MPASPTPTASPPSTPAQPAPVPTTDATPSEVLTPTAILAQLDNEPGFYRPEAFVPFGRVPPFTLLADERVFYVDAGQPPGVDSERLMVVWLTPQQVAAFIQRVYDAGFARVESYTDFCLTMGSEQQECVADAATSVLRIRMPDGTLREVRNYHNFATDREALLAVRSLLADYRNDTAQSVTVERSTVFIQRALGDTSQVQV